MYIYNNAGLTGHYVGLSCLLFLLILKAVFKFWSLNLDFNKTREKSGNTDKELFRYASEPAQAVTTQLNRMQQTIITLFLKSRLMLNMSNQLDSISLPQFNSQFFKKVINLLMFEITAGFCPCYYYYLIKKNTCCVCAQQNNCLIAMNLKIWFFRCLSSTRSVCTLKTWSNNLVVLNLEQRHRWRLNDKDQF